MAPAPPFPPELRHDPAWRAVFPLLEQAFPDDERVWHYVGATSIHFEAMLREGGWSGGERMLLEVAASLFDGETRVSLWEAGHRLGSQHWSLVMEALTLFRSVATE